MLECKSKFAAQWQHIVSCKIKQEWQTVRKTVRNMSAFFLTVITVHIISHAIHHLSIVICKHFRSCKSRVDIFLVAFPCSGP